jgi:hypothetical protein
MQETKKFREMEKEQNDLENCTFIPNVDKYASLVRTNKTVKEAMSNAGFTMFDAQSKTSRIKKYTKNYDA